MWGAAEQKDWLRSMVREVREQISQLPPEQRKSWQWYYHSLAINSWRMAQDSQQLQQPVVYPPVITVSHVHQGEVKREASNCWRERHDASPAAMCEDGYSDLKKQYDQARGYLLKPAEINRGFQMLIECYAAAKKRNEKNKNSKFLFSLANEIGNCYQKLGDRRKRQGFEERAAEHYATATEYYKEAHSFSEKALLQLSSPEFNNETPPSAGGIDVSEWLAGDEEMVTTASVSSYLM